MVKSIVDVEVNDERFQRFVASFNKYNAALKETAPEWGETERATTAAAQATAAITEEMEKQAKAQKKVETEAEKARKAKEKAEREQLERSKRSMSQLKESARGIADFLTGATGSLLKWAGMGGVLGGLLGGGTLFGLDRLASSVSDTRRSSMGLGVSAGDLQAFNLDFGRYVDANHNLSSINEAQADASKRWAFQAMGVENAQERDPADLAGEMARKARDLWNKGGHSWQFAQAHGLDQFYSLADLNRLGKTSDAEFNAAQRSYADDRQTFGGLDGSARAWQDFEVKMRRAGTAIEDNLAGALEKANLPQALTKLSGALAEVVDKFVSSGSFNKMVDDLSHGIEQLGTYLNSPKFQQDLQTFITEFGQVVDVLVKGLKLLGIIHDPAPTSDDLGGQTAGNLDRGDDRSGTPSEHTADVKGFSIKHTGWNAALGYSSVKDRLRAMMGFYKAHGLTNAQMAGVLANDLSENDTLDPNRYGDGGHALGIGQWHEDRQADFRKFAGYRMDDMRVSADTKLRDELAFQMMELDNKQKKAGTALKNDGSNAYGAGWDFSRYDERPKGGAEEAAKRGEIAQKILVQLNINNNTGGNANVDGVRAAAQ